MTKTVKPGRQGPGSYLLQGRVRQVSEGWETFVVSWWFSCAVRDRTPWGVNSPREISSKIYQLPKTNTKSRPTSKHSIPGYLQKPAKTSGFEKGALCLLVGRLFRNPSERLARDGILIRFTRRHPRLSPFGPGREVGTGRRRAASAFV